MDPKRKQSFQEAMSEIGWGRDLVNSPNKSTSDMFFGQAIPHGAGQPKAEPASPEDAAKLQELRNAATDEEISRFLQMLWDRQRGL